MIEEGMSMSETPEAERILKIAAFGFDRPEEAPPGDFTCCSDTELRSCNSDAAQSAEPKKWEWVQVDQSQAVINIPTREEAGELATAVHPTEPSDACSRCGGVFGHSTMCDFAELVRVEPTTAKEGNNHE